MIILPPSGDWFPTFRRALAFVGGFRIEGPSFPTFRPYFGPRRATPPQRRALVRLLATATEERLPLADLVEAWAEDDRGWQVFRLRRLAKELRGGASLPDALERLPGLLSDEETLAVRFAAQSGTLAATLRRMADEEVLSTTLMEGNLRKAWNYLVLFLIVVAPLTSWTTAMLGPMFKAIYRDFGLEVPASMQRSIASTELAGWLWGLTLVVAAALLVGLGPGRLGRWLRRRVAPWLVWPLRGRRLGAVLGWLGESSAAGRPVASALATLARYHYDPAVRQKLLVARNELDLGAELWPTLRGQGLVSPEEADALVAAEPLGLVAWTLGALRDVKRRRADERLTPLSSLLVPLMVTLFAGVVLLMALGMISFLEGLTRGLA